MKKQFFLLMAVMFISFGAAIAQGGQRQTPEERTKTTALFTDLYTQQQKALEEMRASGSMDREAFQAKRKEMNDARDLKLKEIFTADQYKKFKDEIEPAMTPQRRSN